MKKVRENILIKLNKIFEMDASYKSMKDEKELPPSER